MIDRLLKRADEISGLISRIESYTQAPEVDPIALGDGEPAPRPGRLTLGEDASRVRTGQAPQVAASLRNIALFLLRRLAKGQNQGIADAIRDLRFDLPKAVKLVTT